MQQYGVRDVERLLRLPRSTIRALMEAGFVSPARGPRNAWRFSFQDLIVMRTAQALVEAEVPRRHITRSVKALRRRLPQTMPLSGLSVCAVGGRVVVKEGAQRWQAESGQYLLAFEGDPQAGTLSVIERNAPASERSADGWFGEALALENADAAAALVAYEQASAIDPKRADVRINRGRLLHEIGRHREAERVYRDAIAECGADAVLLYNLGVLLEDLARRTEAAEAYEAALKLDPGLADAYYNLALLCRALGRPQEAIRHMAQYRRLASS